MILRTSGSTSTNMRVVGLQEGSHILTAETSKNSSRIVCAATRGRPWQHSVHLRISFTNGSTYHLNPKHPFIIHDIPLVRSASGIYICSAYNHFNSPWTTPRLTFNVSVHYRPDFSRTPSNLIADIGERLRLSCTVSAFPDLQKLDIVFPNGSIISLLHQLDAWNDSRQFRVASFAIDKVSATDAGNYSCMGENSVGNESRQIKVIIIRKYYNIVFS